METVQVLSQHFSKERQLHGLYGLYPKYRPYVHALSGFLLMMGHGLIFATLKTDAGTPSDLRNRIFHYSCVNYSSVSLFSLSLSLEQW